MKKTISEIMVILLLISMLTLAFNIQQAGSSEPPETEWSRTYGGTGEDSMTSFGGVVQTSDGGFAIAGLTHSFGAGGADFWLIKTDAAGNMQWNKTYGGTNHDCANSVIQTTDGGYAIAGETKSFGAGNGDFWLVKVDSLGNMQWNKTYGGTNWDRAWSVTQTSDAGYAILGRAFSYGAGHKDFWLIKADEVGNVEWSQTYGGTALDKAWCVIQTHDGGFSLAGETKSFGAGGDDFWLIKTDAEGNIQWNQTYGGTDHEGAHSVVQTSDGGYAIAGPTHSFGAGGYDFWLIKTDAEGNIQWNQTYGGTEWDNPYSLVQTDDGGYALAGYTLSYGTGDYDVWVVKTDAAGKMEWNQTYGGTQEDSAYSVVETDDRGYAIAGHTNSFGAGGYDFYLVKLAPEEIPATVDIDPDTLNLKSNGQWITAYITLPEGYNVEDIVLETVYLDGVPAAWSEIQNDVCMVKFDRATVQTCLTNEPDYDSAPKFYDLTLTVTGELVDGTPFEGTDTIVVIKK